MKRTKLSDRKLPDYTIGEEIMNMVTHIVGGALGVVVLVLCVIRAACYTAAMGIVGCAIYGVTIVALYTISSVYHGLRPGLAKKVLQVIDHCTIYFLIAGTYTPILFCAFIPTYPVIGWGLYGTRCAQFLFGEGAWRKFVWLQAASVVWGAVLNTGIVWSLSEIANGLMAIPNLIILLYFTPELVRLTAHYKNTNGAKAATGGTYEDIHQCQPL